MWTDHRDLQFPKVNMVPDPFNGDWTKYSPVKPFAPVNCDFVALRNANPYFAEIGGVVAGSPQTFKRLNIQRAFVTYVANRTPQDRFFRLRLVPAAGIRASFEQFTPDVTVTVTRIFALSSHTRSVWVEANATNPTGSVRLVVGEVPGRPARRGGLPDLADAEPIEQRRVDGAVAGPVPPGVEEHHADRLHLAGSAPQVSAFSFGAAGIGAGSRAAGLRTASLRAPGVRAASLHRKSPRRKSPRRRSRRCSRASRRTGRT